MRMTSNATQILYNSKKKKKKIKILFKFSDFKNEFGNSLALNDTYT